MLQREYLINKLLTKAKFVDELILMDMACTEFSLAFKKWKRDVAIILQQIFGENPTQLVEFENIRFSNKKLSCTSDQKCSYIDSLNDAKAILCSMIEEAEDFYMKQSQEALSNSNISIKHHQTNNKIFVIHGHDSGPKEAVARFLSQIGLEPIVLHEQVSRNQTVIEKFEGYTDVSCAIALLTPDDTGGLASSKKKDFSLRARQNVIFELGYFIAKLGRKNVISLKKGDLEIPSDYRGSIEIELDSGSSWKFELTKELKEIGFAIDANKVL